MRKREGAKRIATLCSACLLTVTGLVNPGIAHGLASSESNQWVMKNDFPGSSFATSDDDKRGKFPAVAQISMGTVGCTGTLISTRWVLTVRTCTEKAMQSAADKTKFPPTWVAIGPFAPYQYVVLISQVVWDPNSNLALLRIDDTGAKSLAASAVEWADPVSLTNEQLVVDGSDYLMYGWNNFADASQGAYTVTVYPTSQQSVQFATGDLPKVSVTPAKIRTDNSYTTGVDFGAPIFNTKLELIGINAGVFTNHQIVYIEPIAQHAAWLNHVVGGQLVEPVAATTTSATSGNSTNTTSNVGEAAFTNVQPVSVGQAAPVARLVSALYAAGNVTASDASGAVTASANKDLSPTATAVSVGDTQPAPAENTVAAEPNTNQSVWAKLLSFLTGVWSTIWRFLTGFSSTKD